MGRTITPANKLSRRFGVNLGLKTNAAKVARRLSQPPGVHGPKKRAGAKSSYGKQLLEKQKAKIIYGMRERQFARFVAEATRLPGDSSVTLSRLLEQRLDNVIYRLGFASTRAQARQFVTHGMFMLNGIAMDIPSHLVREGDIITVRESKKKKGPFASAKETLEKKELPSWLTVDAAALTGKVIGMPLPTDMEQVFDVKQIIEHFSAR
mgnify:CR=1 FL=1